MRCHGYGGCSGHGSGAPRTRRAAFELVARSVGCLPIRSVAVGGVPAALPASPPPRSCLPRLSFPGLWLGPVFNSDFQSSYSSDFLSSNSSNAQKKDGKLPACLP